MLQVWLLREKVVEQLHTYIHLVLPASFPALTHKSEIPVAENDDGEVQLTAAELRSLEFERAGRDPDAFVRLVRLAKYFRGVLPVQEILWRESEDELALELVLREFSPILVRSERPTAS